LIGEPGERAHIRKNLTALEIFNSVPSESLTLHESTQDRGNQLDIQKLKPVPEVLQITTASKRSQASSGRALRLSCLRFELNRESGEVLCNFGPEMRSRARKVVGPKRNFVHGVHNRRVAEAAEVAQRVNCKVNDYHAQFLKIIWRIDRAR
jgi:hypothetical protein